MKNTLLLISFTLGVILCACSKNEKLAALVPVSSFSFRANDAPVSYPVNQAFSEKVYNTHTTLITGRYADTASKNGSLSIRIYGDTTGSFRGDSLLVTYVSSDGKRYYNTGDADNVVTIEKFVRKYNGSVSGSFSVLVACGAETMRLSQGIFTALYQE